MEGWPPSVPHHVTGLVRGPLAASGCSSCIMPLRPSVPLSTQISEIIIYMSSSGSSTISSSTAATTTSSSTSTTVSSSSSTSIGSSSTCEVAVVLPDLAHHLHLDLSILLVREVVLLLTGEPQRILVNNLRNAQQGSSRTWPGSTLSMHEFLPLKEWHR